MTTVHRPRYFSNKENTPTIALTDIDAISTSLRSSRTSLSTAAPSHSSASAASAAAGSHTGVGHKKKTALLGIGRAPKFAVKRYKPYGRVSSITRAKKAAAGANTAQTAKASRKAKVAGVKVEAEVKEPVETPEQAEKRIKDAERLQMWRRSVWRPEGGAQAGQVKVPLMLPYPSFPPVENVDMKGLHDVPVQYVREKLFPLLPSISTMTLAFRQFTNVSHPAPNTVPRGSTIPVAIPQVYDGTKPHWADKARGREPDLALQIVQRGHERLEAKPLIIPVMSVVFASQCAYWPKLTKPDHPAGPSGIAKILAEAEKMKREEEEVSRGLPTIGEEEDDEAWESGGSWSDGDSSDGDSVVSLDNPSPLPVPVKDARGFLHIPIVPLPLPSPRTFTLIHRHLHHPARPLLPDLLNLPLECTTRQLVLAAIGDLPVHELMEKLEVLQGVWQNLCCLGMGRVGTWRQLGEAWACVVGVIGGHGLMLQGMMEKPRGEKKTAAEDVAWEWVQMQQAKRA